jgi:hypothetical protein
MQTRTWHTVQMFISCRTVEWGRAQTLYGKQHLMRGATISNRFIITSECLIYCNTVYVIVMALIESELFEWSPSIVGTHIKQ